MGMAPLFSRSGPKEVSLTISSKTFFKVLLLILVTIILLAMLKRAEYALTLIFIAFFLAVALNAPVSWVERHLPGPLRGSRSSATSVSFLIVIVLLGAFIASITPPIIRQTQTFIANAPSIVQNLRSENSSVNQFVERYHLQGQIDQLSAELTDRLKNSTGTAFAAVEQVTSSIFSLVTILVLTFMMLVEGPTWLSALRQILPQHRRAYADRLLQGMYKAVKGYVNGQVALAVIASFMLLPGLLIFHVSYPIALMAVVFVCGLIPMVGHTIGAIIVTFIALFTSPWSAVGILIYYILYQQIENYLIQPRLQANTTNLSPLLVLVSVVVGVSFGGLLGGLVAIPAVACLRVWVVDYLHSRNLLEAAIPAVEAPAKKG